ncbi:MAG: ABC transporter ATP-binding protein [Erysipelotrichaceae bacterium]|nr:ABC transporter ATP-binding protein [Erysipelotrichaceae bacterium]
MMEKNILEIQNLTKYYGKVLGVENLSLKLQEGEIFGFIGPNGAGKSTTIRSIMNLINKTSGRVLIDNEEFNKDDKAIKEKIGYLPSEIHLYDDLTVKEMLDYHENFYKRDIHGRRMELVKRLELDEKKKIEDLSLGNLKKLGIVLAFMHEPKILILDEPTSGLDPIMQNVFYDLLKEERAKGNTVFYSTHILTEVSKICDRVGIIKNGQLIKVEKVEELSKKSLTFVTVTSKQAQEIINDLNVNTVSEDGNTIKFGNHMPHDELIKKLSNYTIDRILIEEATLEDMFLHYYK